MYQVVGRFYEKKPRRELRLGPLYSADEIWELLMLDHEIFLYCTRIMKPLRCVNAFLALAVFLLLRGLSIVWIDWQKVSMILCSKYMWHNESDSRFVVWVFFVLLFFLHWLTHHRRILATALLRTLIWNGRNINTSCISSQYWYDDVVHTVWSMTLGCFLLGHSPCSIYQL